MSRPPTIWCHFHASPIEVNRVFSGAGFTTPGPFHTEQIVRAPRSETLEFFLLALVSIVASL